MKRNVLIVLSLCIGLLAASIPVLAHHAIAAEFDSTKPIKFEGTVKTIDWMNPHIYVNIETQEAGKTVVYSVEGGPPNALYRRGFTRDSLPLGIEIVVEGFRAKDGSMRGNGRDLTFPDGRKLFLGSSGTGAPLDGKGGKDR